MIRLLDVRVHHRADSYDSCGARRAVLFPLDDVDEPGLGIGPLRQAVEGALPEHWKSARVGAKARPLDSSLGNDHVVVPGVDKTNRAVVVGFAQSGLGTASEAPYAAEASPTGNWHLDAADLCRQDS